MNNNSGVSVIVCCYNSARTISKTINNLIQQKKINFNYEIIIVDNNCNDNTLVIVENYKKMDKVDINVITEKMPGQMNARRTGISNANYNTILFCDDDNWLDNNYVSIAYKYLENNLDVGIIGGFSEFTSSVKPPKWFFEITSSYAISQPYEKSGYKSFVFGAGMMIRKSILDKILGLELIFTGRSKNILNAGDDSELCIITRLLGYKIFFNENIKFKHHINEERFTWEYSKRLHEGFGFCTIPNYLYYHKLDKINPIVRICKYLIKKLPIILFASDKEGNIKYLEFIKYRAVIKSFHSYMYYRNKINLISTTISKYKKK